MMRLGFVGEVKNGNKNSDGYWKIVDGNNYLDELRPQDLSSLQKIKNTFKKYSNAELIKYTYRKYPYYAIKSSISNNYLNKRELKIIENSRPKSNRRILFTIGYEGMSLEKYLNELLRHDVVVLCDVRKNPLSRKYGFSMNQLRNACESMGISYVHIPNLGIESEKRRNLKSQSDYNTLFREYRNTTLNVADTEMQLILDLIKSRSRVAITCFEADIECCHRKHLAEKLCEHPQWKYEVRHI
jgi:uncharacterized protein (DUF488 family)